jgi:hypothetical protein
MKFKLAILCFMTLSATIASAQLHVNVDRKLQPESNVITSTEQLSQQQYDEKIEAYISEVNETKLILDEAEPASIRADEQKQALCKRIRAYRNIFNLSEQNPSLDTATTMKYVAQAFLSRQKQSFESAGMTESYFCGAEKSDFVKSKS